MWTDGVIRELRKRGVRDDIISAALSEAYVVRAQVPQETVEKRNSSPSRLAMRLPRALARSAP